MSYEMKPDNALHLVERGRDSAPVADFTADNLFRRYSRYVAFIAHRIVGDPSDVEDLVQEVFLDAHRGLRYRDSEAEIKGWLSVVTTRRAQRFLRRRKLKQMFGLGEAPDYRDLVDPGATPEQAALARSVYRQLDRLPVKDRIAWTLRHVQGETLERTAELAGCSRATAHRRITAASVALKEMLGDE
ncbi:MAG: RNA polymerase sigma factor [Deltaproteobacteria bacterium]|nr:RNA polymerase sigma factor [Deltaproteobacteria bacterium]